MSEQVISNSSRRQSLFSALGWVGFIFLVPLVLKAIGIPGLANWLASNLGMWGSPSFLLIYFYFFPLLDLIFGSDRHLSPLLNGFVASFLAFAIVVPLPFMNWYANLFSGLTIVHASIVFLAIGVLAMILGIMLSYVRRGVGILGQILIIFGLPIAGIVSIIVWHLDTVLKLPVFSL